MPKKKKEKKRKMCENCKAFKIYYVKVVIRPKALIVSFYFNSR